MANRGPTALKILGRNFKKGFVKVIPKTLDDLWHLYNLIYEGDIVSGRTSREVKSDANYSRPQKGKRVSVLLSLRVETVLWDRSLNRLRIRGKIHEAPEDVAGRGSYHTLNVVLNRPITIVRDTWLKHQIDRLNKATLSPTPSIIVVSVDSAEYCVAVIREYGVDVQVEGVTRLPSKQEAEKRSDAISRYFREVLKALKEVWQRDHFPVVIIGVGMVKTQFHKYLNIEAGKIAESILDVKSVNNGGLAGIKEALRSGVLDKTLKHLRVVEEAKIVEEVLARLGKGQRNVTYGVEQIIRADSVGAVEELLVADFTLRGSPDEERRVLEKLMTGVEGKRGSVTVISTEHEAGQKLLSLGGVAALLRFPVS